MAPTPLPPSKVTAGGLWSSLDDQTAKLSLANGRTGDLVQIADTCQAQQVKLRAALRPSRHWWKFWGG